MTLPFHRTIDELIARYTLEPGLRDIYVEGSLDAVVIRWHLESIGCRDFAIYEIGSVDVPDLVVLESHQTTGNRGSIVGLARKLEAAFPGGTLRVLCIADADTDTVRPRVAPGAYLALTDTTSMEMYLCTAETIERLLKLVLRKPRARGSAAIRAISGALAFPFAVRVVAIDLGLNLKMVPMGKSCQAVSGRVVIDTKHYLTRVAGASNAAAKTETIGKEVAGVLKGLPDDIRLCGDGHDFIEVLFWYVRHVLSDRTIPTSDLLGRALTGCIATDLTGFALFDRVAAVACD